MAEFWKDCISHTINWFLCSPCEHRNTIVKCTVGVILTFFWYLVTKCPKLTKAVLQLYSTIFYQESYLPRALVSPKALIGFKGLPSFTYFIQNFQNNLETTFTPWQSTIRKFDFKNVCLRHMFVVQHKLFKYLTWFLSVNPVIGVEEQTVKTFNDLALFAHPHWFTPS